MSHRVAAWAVDRRSCRAQAAVLRQRLAEARSEQERLAGQASLAAAEKKANAIKVGCGCVPRGSPPQCFTCIQARPLALTDIRCTTSWLCVQRGGGGSSLGGAGRGKQSCAWRRRLGTWYYWYYQQGALPPSMYAWTAGCLPDAHAVCSRLPSPNHRAGHAQVSELRTELDNTQFLLAESQAQLQVRWPAG